MKNPLLILAVIVIATGYSFAEDVTGDWNGKLSVNGGELRLDRTHPVVHGQRADRADLGVGAVRARPRRQVARRLVA